MQAARFPTLLLFLACCAQAIAQTAPAPLATPNDIPVPLAQPAKPAAPAVCPECGSATCGHDEKPAAETRPAESDEAALVRLEQEWGDAIARHDADFLERLETDDYTYTGPDGVISHKADEIAAAKAEFARIESFKHRNVKVRVYGETAVVTGATTLRGKAGESNMGGDFRWLDVFVKRNGRWQVVASQATEISKSGSDD